ncbi:MAG TPA: hypothetical protein VFQ21_08140 [Gemmatimonadota bacterium]|nr:hypothetical protein [Gemmatimonadota bacterium]
MNGSLRALGCVLTVAVGVLLAPVGLDRALAQTPDTLAGAQDASLGALRTQIESRYQVRSLRDGILLLPSYGNPGIQTVELSDGEIAIDGRSVTGAELRERVPEDAEAILRLSYLAPDDRRILFGIGGAPMPGDTAAMAEGDTAAMAEDEADEGIVQVESSDDRVRVGASVHVREDEVVRGDVVAVLGSVDVDGTVTGDVVAVGGSVELGPNAVVEGEVVVVGGTLERAPGARVEGSVEEVAWGGPNIHMRGPEFQTPFLEGIGGLMMTIIWVVVLGALAALMYLLARRPVERMAYRVAKSPWKAALVGLVGQILFFPVLILTVILLAVSIIGIPLLLVVPFAVLALMIGTLVGFTAVARNLGAGAESRFGWQHDNPYIAVLVGVGIIMLVSFFASALGVAGGPLGVFALILGILGFVIQYAAWTVGFGALLLTRFGTRYGWGETAGPEPSPAPAVPVAHGPEGTLPGGYDEPGAPSPSGF